MDATESNAIKNVDDDEKAKKHLKRLNVCTNETRSRC